MKRAEKRILIICPFPRYEAAGQRLKYEQYLDDWRREGYDVTVSSFMDNRMWNIVYKKGHLLEKIKGTLRGWARTWKTIFCIPGYDIVYVFMYVMPVGTPFPEWLTRILAKKIIYDIEDNVMLQQKNNLNPITGLIRAKGKFNYLIKHADHVITSSPALREFCSSKNKFGKATYISASMDTERFIPVNKYANDHKMVIGWTGTFSSEKYLDLLRPVLLSVRNQRDFKLLLIGNFEYSFPEMDLEVIQWTAKNEVTDLQKMDIGLYPLPMDDWVSGKSGLKAIQYMTIGIPVVGTNVGNTPFVIRDRKDGCLVNNEQEWVNTLIQLIDEPGLRESIGRRARITVEKRFSRKVIVKEYLAILNSV